MKDKLYLPSNGTEGMIFMAEFCENCYKEKQCTILTRALICEQPKQWIYKNNKPVCTSFNPNRPKQKRKVKIDKNQINLFI